MFEAIVFCVVDCGFSPRSALEQIDSGDVRLRVGQIGQKFGVVPLPREKPLIVLEGILQQLLAQLTNLARVLVL